MIHFDISLSTPIALEEVT